MSTFAALLVDPYAQTATVVELASTPQQSAARPTFEAVVASGQLYAFAANANAVPVAHWPLFAPLVHAGRGDAHDFAASETLDLGVRLVYKHTTFRGMLWARDDMPPAGTPERDAIPGFRFLDSAQPGVWWNGRAALVLYERAGPRTHADRAFLEVRQRAKLCYAKLNQTVALSGFGSGGQRGLRPRA